MKKLLCIVDMQNSFVDKKGSLSIKNCGGLVDRLNSFISCNNNFFDVALITQDTHFAEEYKKSPESIQFPMHCEYLSWDWQLAFSLDILAQNIPIYLFYKNVFDMWSIEYEKVNKILSSTFLFGSSNSIGKKEFFKRYNSKEYAVYICGVAADYCVKYAIDGFLKNNYKVFILEDLIRGIFCEIDQVIKKAKYSSFLLNNKLNIIKL